MNKSQTSYSLDEIRAKLPNSAVLLNWDSNHFGFPVGRTGMNRPDNAQLTALLQCCVELGLGLVYCFTNSKRSLADTILKPYGGKLVDRRTTFVAEVEDLLKLDAVEVGNHINIQEHPCGNPSPDLLDLSVLAGRYSRFALDTRVPRERFEAMYQQWIKRSTRRELADIVFVATLPDNSLAGFVTVRRQGDKGEIGLVAVSNAAQGRGIGKELMRAAHQWMASHQISTASVVTQQANEAASRLYRNAGYKLASIEPTYHFWLQSDELQAQ